MSSLREKVVHILSAGGPIPVHLPGGTEPIAYLQPAPDWHNEMAAYTIKQRRADVARAAKRLKLPEDVFAEHMLGDPTLFYVAFTVAALSGELVKQTATRTIKGIKLNRWQLCKTCEIFFLTDSNRKTYCSDGCELAATAASEAARSKNRSKAIAAHQRNKRAKAKQADAQINAEIDGVLENGTASARRLVGRNHAAQIRETASYRAALARMATTARQAGLARRIETLA